MQTLNWLKPKIVSQPSVNGVWLVTGSHATAEIAGAAGFDWALLDMEHGFGDAGDTLRQIQVLAHSSCASIVRVPRFDSDATPRMLDYGAAGIMAPMVNTAEQAATFVRTMRYPPAGMRGMASACRAARYGHDFADYFQQANDHVTAMVQIETAEGVANADAIAAVAGVDVLFIGHSDLSLNLGCYEQLNAPAIVEAEAAVVAACQRHGKHAGMLLKTGYTAASFRQKGFTVIALGSDQGCVQRGFAELLKNSHDNP